MKLVIYILVFLTPYKLFSQLNSNIHTDTVKVGFYVTSIRNIDFSNNIFNADLWVWFHYKNHDSIPNNPTEKTKIFPKCLEWPDALDANNGGQPIYNNDNVDDSTAKILWKAVRLSCPFRKKWNLVNYPFDVQQISLKLESADFTSNDLVLQAISGKIDDQFTKKEVEWEFYDICFHDGIREFKTTFGDPIDTLGNMTSKYSAVEMTFKMKRNHSWITFMKLFTGILISFLICLSVFLIKPTNTDARFGLCVGALFSAIGSKYIVDGMIPVNYQNTLFDNIHNITFFYIFIITLISIFSLKWLESDNIKLHIFSKKLDKIGLISCLLSYFIIISVLVINYR